MTEFTYSLKHYFEEAKVNPIPQWFSEIGIWHPTRGWIKPLWHQITGLNGAFVYSRYGLFDEMATGKTMIAQAYCLWHSWYNNRPLCLMPPILMPQFKRKLYEMFPGSQKYINQIVYHGTPKQREKIAHALLTWDHSASRFPIIVTTPDMFRAEFPLFQRLGCCVINMDEAEYISNPDTKTATAVKLFMGSTYGDKCSLIMNGTPGNNDPRDVYGYIYHLTPDIYRSRVHFENLHVDYKEIDVRTSKPGEDEKFIKVKQVEQFKNFDLLNKNLYLQARRVEKSQVLDLPSLDIIPININLSGKHREKYDEFSRAKVMLFPDGSAISGEQSSSMRNYAMQGVMQPDIFQVKERSAVLTIVEQLVRSIGPAQHKIFIAAYYHKSVELLVEAFKHLGAVAIYGDNTSVQNARNKDIFINNDACRVLVANYESGGVGLDGLQDVCWYGIAAEPISVPGRFEQWRDRLHRNGQNHKVTLYTVHVQGTIWMKCTASMYRKAEWNEAVVSRERLMKDMRGEGYEDVQPAA
jgi:hypothetical protein